jgi:hypothetical protein
VLRAKEHAPTHFPFDVFIFGFVVESSKELGGASPKEHVLIAMKWDIILNITPNPNQVMGVLM